jgi:hypothetical protein
VAGEPAEGEAMTEVTWTEASGGRPDGRNPIEAVFRKLNAADEMRAGAGKYLWAVAEPWVSTPRKSGYRRL